MCNDLGWESRYHPDGNVTTTGFALRFQEWDYLDGLHAAENVPWLALEPGRYDLPDGSIWEVGTFNQGSTGSYKSWSYSAPFPGTPRLFLTVQSTNESDAVTVRARSVSATGFQAALYEQQANMSGGHLKERIGYLAIYTPAQQGSVDIDGTLRSYSLEGNRIGNAFTTVIGNRKIRQQEEASQDDELQRKAENTDLLLIGGQLFGQVVEVRSKDTASLRRR